MYVPIQFQTLWHGCKYCGTLYPSDKIRRSHVNNGCKQNPEKIVKTVEKKSSNGVLKEKPTEFSASQTFQNHHTTALQTLVENIPFMTQKELFESEMLPPDRCVMSILVLKKNCPNKSPLKGLTKEYGLSSCKSR